VESWTNIDLLRKAARQPEHRDLYRAVLVAGTVMEPYGGRSRDGTCSWYRCGKEIYVRRNGTTIHVQPDLDGTKISVEMDVLTVWHPETGRLSFTDILTGKPLAEYDEVRAYSYNNALGVPVLAHRCDHVETVTVLGSVLSPQFQSRRSSFPSVSMYGVVRHVFAWSAHEVLVCADRVYTVTQDAERNWIIQLVSVDPTWEPLLALDHPAMLWQTPKPASEYVLSRVDHGTVVVVIDRLPVVEVHKDAWR